MSHNYRIKYNIVHDIGNFPKEEIKASGLGGTDCLLIGSMLHPEDGSYSQIFYSIDGRNEGKDLSSNDEFKFWIMMAGTLKDRKDLSPGKKAFVEDVFETFRLAMLGAGPCVEGEQYEKTTDNS